MYNSSYLMFNVHIYDKIVKIVMKQSNVKDYLLIFLFGGIIAKHRVNIKTLLDFK
jgi:hypothetical protein